MRVSLFFISFLIISSLAKAENSYFVSGWNQMLKGQYCLSVNDDETMSSGFGCRAKTPENIKLFWSSSNALEHLAFDAAAGDQILKDQCLIQQIERIPKDPKLLRRWKSSLMLAYLGKKKAELMLQVCTPDNSTSGGVGNVLGPVPPVQYREQFEAYREKVHKNDLALKQVKRTDGSQLRLSAEEMKKWQPICSSQTKMKAMAEAADLFSYMVPTVSDPVLFELMDQQRSEIISKKTNHPLSDKELLALNLESIDDLKTINFSPDSKSAFSVGVNDFFKDLTAAKSKTIARIQTEKAQGSYSEDIKDYLFQEGTLIEVLKREFPGMQKALDDMGQGLPAKMPNGPACILSRHEEGMTGDIAELGTYALGGAGLYYKAMTSTPKVLGKISRIHKAAENFQKLNTLTKLKRSAMIGAIPIGLNQMGRQLYRHCFSSQRKVKKFENVSLKEDEIRGQAAALPEEMGWSFMTIDDSKTLEDLPACQKTDAKNLSMNSFYRANCVREAIMNVVPLSVGLPYELLEKK